MRAAVWLLGLTILARRVTFYTQDAVAGAHLSDKLAGRPLQICT
jgi:hypothetical protein